MAGRNISPVCSTPSGSRPKNLAKFATAPDGRRADYLGESPCRLIAQSSQPLRTPSSSEPASCGMFQVFELGLLGLKAELIDFAARHRRAVHGALSRQTDLRHSGGAGVHGARAHRPAAGADQAVRGRRVHLGQEVTSVVKREDGRFDVETSRGTRFDAGTVIIAAGVGSFQPRKLECAGRGEA